ncbi:hypothetical protein [Methylobacterium sp. 1973]|uniref:hypothetical protein n=1 Tax=Methylobacterium sp. 1973 TaxID=3156421 RepID=UPI00339757B9
MWSFLPSLIATISILLAYSVEAKSQEKMVLGPFPSEFSYEKLKLLYSAKLEIENILLNKEAQIQGHAIIDLSSISKNIKNIISSQVRNENLRLGDDDFGISFLPENVTLKAVKDTPIVAIDITLNKLKLAGFELASTFEKAIRLQVPLNFQLNQVTGAEITTGKPSVSFNGELKTWLDRANYLSGGQAQKWVEDKIISTVSFQKKFPIPQLDAYRVEIKSYKACFVKGKYLFDAKISAILSADILNPLLASALSSKFSPQPKVRVIIPVSKATPL